MADDSTSAPLGDVGPELMPRDDVFDLLRGLAALTGSAVIAGAAEVVVKHPGARLSVALNHKQVASKAWLVDRLARTLDRPVQHALIVGGWIGTLSAMLAERLGNRIGTLTSLDIDPSCAPAALTLNRALAEAGRFRAVTADMHGIDLATLSAGAPPIDLVVNTSCEHIPNVRAWLDGLPRGITVVLQSNDYFAVPEHVSCVPDLAAFQQQARLSRVLLADAIALRKYTRFMLIGQV